jgi:hypothetical protein
MNYFIDDMISGLLFNPQYQSMSKAIALISAEKVVEQRKQILDFIASVGRSRSPQINHRKDGGCRQPISDDCDVERCGEDCPYDFWEAERIKAVADFGD